MAAMEAGVDCLMTSHPLYPNLDPEPRTPATFSRLIVDDYLRGQVGYRGVVASDDLEMGAITDLCPIGEATVRAAAAGHDLLLVCHTEAAQRAAHQALLAAYRSRALSVRSLERSVSRLDALAARRGRPLRRRAGAPRARWRAPRQGHRRARRHRRDATGPRASGEA
jgi:beta-N-acetylhexosaminidase